jgi:hypothetical protein
MYAVITATCKRDNEVTWSTQVRVDDDLSNDGNHFVAAKKLVNRYLQGNVIVASGYDKDGQYFIAAPGNA